jgi:hypothetical protein
MAGTKALKGVINGFIGTFVSRHSDYDGYWLFGFLVPRLTTLRVDLLNPPSHSDQHCQRVIDLATLKLREQLAKSKLDPRLVRNAQLTISRGDNTIILDVNGYPRKGWPLEVSIAVEDLRGRRYDAAQVIVVATHNAAIETRSPRTRDG